MKGVRKIKWSDRLKIFITQIGGEYKVGLQLSGSEELPKEETNAIKKFLKRYTRKSR